MLYVVPDKVVADVQKRSQKVKTNAEIAQVGTISANGDKDVGDMIASAMERVGNEGVITVEEAKSLHSLRLVLCNEFTFRQHVGNSKLCLSEISLCCFIQPKALAVLLIVTLLTGVGLYRFDKLNSIPIDCKLQVLVERFVY